MQLVTRQLKVYECLQHQKIFTCICATTTHIPSNNSFWSTPSSKRTHLDEEKEIKTPGDKTWACQHQVRLERPHGAQWAGQWRPAQVSATELK